jgi:hypothetical protein
MRFSRDITCLDCSYLDICDKVSMICNDDGYADVNDLKSLAFDCSHYYNPKEYDYGKEI